MLLCLLKSIEQVTWIWWIAMSIITICPISMCNWVDNEETNTSAPSWRTKCDLSTIEIDYWNGTSFHSSRHGFDFWTFVFDLFKVFLVLNPFICKAFCSAVLFLENQLSKTPLDKCESIGIVRFSWTFTNLTFKFNIHQVIWFWLLMLVLVTFFDLFHVNFFVVIIFFVWGRHGHSRVFINLILD